MNSMNAEYDYLFKLLLIGNSGVGKSCMLMRYSEGEFTNNFYNTIGVDFKIKSIPLDGKNIKLQIWDTAGQDRFRTITCSYYRGAHGIIIAYDITDRDSFENVKTWMQEIEKYAQENVTKLLIGNKNDLTDKRKVTYEEGAELAKGYNIAFLETSAKSANNIDLCFTTIARKVMEKMSATSNLRENKGVRLNGVRGAGGNQPSNNPSTKNELENCC